MPRMDAAIYAAHMDSVLRMAAKAGGVSRPQLINDLNVTRAVATKLIEKCNLVKVEQGGRTEFFVPSNGDDAPNEGAMTASAASVAASVVKRSTPAAVKAVAVAQSDDRGTDAADPIADLDQQILETRSSLHAAAVLAGEALGVWGTQSAVVDALRKTISDLVTKRMAMSPK